MSTDQVIATAIERYRSAEGPLLPILHAVQDELGFIPTDAVPAIAVALGLSRAEVHGVISFYHDFRSEAGGRHCLQICRAEACQAVGSRELERHALDALGIAFGETTEDGRLTLEAVYCLGNCACSPSVRLDDTVHGRVDTARFDALLADLADEDAP